MNEDTTLTSPSRIPWIIGGFVAVAVLTQMRGLIRDAGDETQEIIDQAGQAVSDVVHEAQEPGGLVDQARQVAVEVVETARSPEEIARHTGEAAKEVARSQDVGGLLDEVRQVPPGDLVRVAGDVVHGGIKGIDLVGDELIGLTVEEEIAVGQREHQRVMSEFAESSDPALRAWVADLFGPMARQRIRTKDMPFHVTVLDTDMVNAFSHAGGYVYMCRGMIEQFQRDPHAVQFVLGHEVAHIELGQCARRVYVEARAANVGGAISGRVGGLLHRTLQVGYSQQDELDCDEWSFRALGRLGRTKEQRLHGVNALVEMAHSRGEHELEVKPESVPAALVEEVRDHFCTHPPAQERVARLERID